MSRAEQEGMPYLFKLRSTRNVKRLIEKAMGEADWTAAGQGWQGKASTLRLQGWSRHRRVVIPRSLPEREPSAPSATPCSNLTPARPAREKVKNPCRPIASLPVNCRI